MFLGAYVFRQVFSGVNFSSFRAAKSAAMVFLLFIRNFECSYRGGDVIKARHPLEPATSRKSPLLSCSTPQSLFCVDYFLCLWDTLYPMLSLDVLSVFCSYLARDLNLGYFCGGWNRRWRHGPSLSDRSEHVI